MKLNDIHKRLTLLRDLIERSDVPLNDYQQMCRRDVYRWRAKLSIMSKGDIVVMMKCANSYYQQFKEIR